MALELNKNKQTNKSPPKAGDWGSIPGSGRSSGEGIGNPLQYSCLENPMDGGAWWAAVHVVAKNWTRLNDFTFTLILSSMRKCVFTCMSNTV